MTLRGWIINQTEDRLSLSRDGRVQFDVSAQTVLPAGSARRYAIQIRQDLWRHLKNQRGLSPVVEVTRDGAQVIVRAGGRVTSVVNRPVVNAQIAALLDNPALRARWVRHAKAGSK